MFNVLKNSPPAFRLMGLLTSSEKLTLRFVRRHSSKPHVACWLSPAAPKRIFHSCSKLFRRHHLRLHV
jgi:hypothetical protein